MTTIYTFPVIYTRGGIATSPSPAPTVQVIDSANNILVAALTAVTAVTNMPGAYYYSYSGADNLICWALFHTTDVSTDKRDIGVYTPAQTYIGNVNILTVDGVVDAIKLKTDNLPTDPADESALEALIADLPTNTELATALGTADDAVLAAVAALNNLSIANIRTAVGLATANLDTQLADLPTNAELATALGTADDAVLAAVAALNNLDAAGIRTAVGLATANLDTQLADLPTNAELATSQAAADDATLAAIAAWSGAGSITWTYTLNDQDTNPLPGATVWVTSDAAGAIVLASGVTNASGQCTFYLNAGVIYVWVNKVGYTFPSPDQETVV